eukprot:g27705.t1
MLLIFGYMVQGVGGASWSEDLLVGLHLDLAKLAINRSRPRAVEVFVMADCLPLFCGYVRARVSLETEYAGCTDALNAFRERWASQ